MEDRDDDKLSSSLPETLHPHIIRPDVSGVRLDEASSSAQDRRPAQRRAPRTTHQFISSLTPATFPCSLGPREMSSPNEVSLDMEDDRESAHSVLTASTGQGRSAHAHPSRSILIPHGPGSSERPFYHQYSTPTYTFPPPTPSQVYMSSSNTYQWSEGSAGPSSSHRARGPGSENHDPEGYQEGDDDFGSTREIMLPNRAQKIHHPRPGQPILSLFARDVTRSPDNSPHLYTAAHSYNDSRYLRHPHLPDPGSIRHHSLPPQRWDQPIRPGSRYAPGVSLDDRSIERASSYSLPPLSALLTPLGPEYRGRDRGPQLPRIELPDTQETPPRDVSAESSSETPNDSTASTRGKRKRDTNVLNEKKTKAGKIYVACDFCRGRKLRCDGTKPSCANCSTRALKCDYQDHPRRRGPGKAPKGSRTKKSDGKGRKGGTTSKAAPSAGGREFGSEPSFGAPDRHVFEPPMMLPGHGPPHLSELEATHAPQVYDDRPSASNTHREGAGGIPRHQFRGSQNMFEHGLGEGQAVPFRDWRQDGDEEDGGSLDSGYALPPGSVNGETDEETSK